jgi:hypothetical protein
MAEVVMEVAAVIAVAMGIAVVILVEVEAGIAVVILVEVAVGMVVAVVAAAEEASGCWFVVLNKIPARVTSAPVVTVRIVRSAPSVIPRGAYSLRKMHPLNPPPRHLNNLRAAIPMLSRQLLAPQGSLVRPSLQHNRFSIC